MLRHIRPLLSHDVANTVACSIVSSHLDYCNALLYCTTQKNITKLQRVQNSLARVVTGTRRCEHIRPVLKELHWLPVAQCIEYKIAVITHKVLATSQPAYLYDIVDIHKPSRHLHSSLQRTLTIKPTKTVIGGHGFSSASPKVWNTLPDDLRTMTDFRGFKSKLKTHLFKSAFIYV